MTKISNITDAKLSLELVDKAIWKKFKKRKFTPVEARQLKSAPDLLLSESFARCQGICFLDEGKLGALCHNYPAHDPFYTLTGRWTCENSHLEDPRQLFSNPKKVRAVHVYHINCHSWPEIWIQDALKNIGIEGIVHLPIKPKSHGVFCRDVAFDVKEGAVYVFPNDFDVGLKYRIGEKK